MVSKSRSLLLAATLLAAPMGVAMAQQSTTSSGPNYNAPTTMPSGQSSSAATNPDMASSTAQTPTNGTVDSNASTNPDNPSSNGEAAAAGGGGGH
jgi:hypothetical protein